MLTLEALPVYYQASGDLPIDIIGLIELLFGVNLFDNVVYFLNLLPGLQNAD